MTSFVRFQNGEEEHVLDVGGSYTRPHWLIGPVGRIRIFSSTLELTMASAWWGSPGAIGTRYVCVQSMTKKLLHYGDQAVVRPRDIPNVGVTLGMTLSSLPPAWKGPLSVLIDNLPIFNNHVDRAQVQLIITGTSWAYTKMNSCNLTATS